MGAWTPLHNTALLVAVGALTEETRDKGCAPLRIPGPAADGGWWAVEGRWEEEGFRQLRPVKGVRRQGCGRQRGWLCRRRETIAPGRGNSGSWNSGLNCCKVSVFRSGQHWTGLESRALYRIKLTHRFQKGYRRLLLETVLKNSIGFVVLTPKTCLVQFFCNTRILSRQKHPIQLRIWDCN